MSRAIRAVVVIGVLLFTFGLGTALGDTLTGVVQRLVAPAQAAQAGH